MAALAAAALASPVTARLADRLSTRPSLCPLRAVLGAPCPSCGATRAALRLASGDVAAAVASNAGATIFMCVVGAGVLLGAWSLGEMFGVAKPENPVADSGAMATASAAPRILVTA